MAVTMLRAKPGLATVSKNAKETEFHTITAPRVHAAAAQRPTKKDEDVTHIALRQPNATGQIPSAAFAIFDGHGGKKAAQMSVEGISGRLLKEAGPITNMMIEDAFWELDADLGEAGIHAGTTASVLLVEHTGDLLECALAWVGDSTAVQVDMLAAADNCKVFVTDDHSPKNEAEVYRMEVEWALRKELHKDWDWVSRETGSVHGGSRHGGSASGKSQKDSYASNYASSDRIAQSATEQECLPTEQATNTADTNDSASADERGEGSEATASPTEDEGTLMPSAGPRKLRQDLFQARKAYLKIAKALRDVTGVEPTSQEVALYLRVMAREVKVSRAAATLVFKAQAHNDRQSRSACAELCGDCAFLPEPDPELYDVERRVSTIGGRGSKGGGPMAVTTHFEGIGDGASTMVTRSIGDWDAARAVIPQPDIHRFTVEIGSKSRVLLCSDGVWDLISTDTAAAIARAGSTPEAVARKIVNRVESLSMQRFGRLKDDTSIVVVDLDLTTPEQQEALKRTRTLRGFWLASMMPIFSGRK